MLDASIDTLAISDAPNVQDPQDVADRLDVLVALGAPAVRSGDVARIVLHDGTRLVVRETTDAATSLATVDADALPDCASCIARDAPGDVRRVRVNGPLARDARIVVDGYELVVEAAPVDVRVRWVVLLIDSG